MKIVLLYMLIALILSIIMYNILESVPILLILSLLYSICDIISFIILDVKFNIDLELLSKYFAIIVLISSIIYILLSLIQIIFLDIKFKRCRNLIESGHNGYKIYSQFIKYETFDMICLNFLGWTLFNTINMMTCFATSLNSINNI